MSESWWGTPQVAYPCCLPGPLATLLQGPRLPSEAAMDVGHPPCTACHGLNDPRKHSLCICGAGLCQSDYRDTSLTKTPWLAAGGPNHVSPSPVSLLDNRQQVRNPETCCPDVRSPRLSHQTTGMAVPGTTVLLMLRPHPSLSPDTLKLLLSGPLLPEEESSLTSPVRQ